MTVKYLKDYDIEYITDLIQKCKSTSSDGRPSFSGLEFSQYLIVLNSAIKLHKEIDEQEKTSLIRKAVFTVTHGGMVNPDTLLSELNVLEKEYLRQREEKYCLATTISINPRCQMKRIKINGTTITFSKRLPQRFHKEIDKEIIPNAKHSIFGELPRNYTFIKAHSIGKTVTQAYNNAIDAIDITRGIWSFGYNFKQNRMSSGRRDPVNKIVLGPLQTMHFPNGKLATKTWWYEPDYQGPLSLFDPCRDLDKLYRFQDQTRRRLATSNFKDFLESALVRYVRSLDLRNWQSSFLRLWAILETLTNTGEGENHKVTIKRTAFLFHDKKYTSQVLNHLRTFRNKAVHVGEGSQEIETLMYQVKYYVEVVFQFLLYNEFKFKNLGDVGEFLSLPDDIGILKKRSTFCANALNFIEK